MAFLGRSLFLHGLIRSLLQETGGTVNVQLQERDK